MDIEDPEFLSEMKAIGEEMFRCFFEAHLAFDFAATAKTELEGFAEKLKKANRIPELEMVLGALETVHRLQIHIELQKQPTVK